MGKPAVPFRRDDVRADAFWSNVDKSGDCWLWTGWLNSHGYGGFRVIGHSIQAHRVSFVLDGGVIPDGFELDHLCRTRACVRPSHLEAVSSWENRRRGMSPTAINARRTHCAAGHEFTPANTYIRKQTGTRACRTCGSASHRAARAAS